MNPNRNIVQAIIKRLTQRMEAENEPKHPGVITNYEARQYDDGEYGDPMIDTRPDFVRRDDEGWARLK